MLTEVGVHIGPLTATSISRGDYLIYEMGTAGQYTVAAYGSVVSKSLDADGYVSTPAISVPLLAGRTYEIAFHIDQGSFVGGPQPTYADTAPENISFGQGIGSSYLSGFVASPIGVRETTRLYTQRLRTRSPP